MSGELGPVLLRSWKEVWLPLARLKEAPPELFSELVAELVSAPPPPLPLEQPPMEAFDAEGVLIDPTLVAARAAYDKALARHAKERDAFEVAVSGGDARPLFRSALQKASLSEAASVALLEGADEALGAYGVGLRARYRTLATTFIRDHNLGYEVRNGFQLIPTMPGVFSRLLREIKLTASAHQHTQQMFSEFEEAFFDLRLGRTEARLKTCLLRQFNLLESLGRQVPNVTALTLGDICGQLQWPHVTIREVGKKLNGFRSDYPGIGHAGNPTANPLTVKDFVSISMMLASITPYFVADLDGELCYGG